MTDTEKEKNTGKPSLKDAPRPDTRSKKREKPLMDTDPFTCDLPSKMRDRFRKN